jgi:hypothetical protein
MPFKTNNELELNFIWLGNPMPPLQLNNLVNILLKNPQVQINIWVDSEATWNDFKKNIAPIVNNFVSHNKNITKQDIYKNLCPQMLTPVSMQLPKELEKLLEVFKNAKLWATISDIARLLILSRKVDPKAKARHARVYVEADNEMLPEFWQKAFQSKDVAAIYVESIDGEKLFPPQAIRGDCIFIDVDSPQGEAFAANIRKHLLTIFNDPMMAGYIKALKDHAEQIGGLHSSEVMETFGMLFQAILRMQFMTTEKETLFGMKDILIPKSSVKGLIKHGYFGVVEHSWVQVDKPKLMRGMVRDLFSLRLAEISDPSGIIVAKMLVEAQRKFPRNTISNKKDYLDLVQMVLEGECDGVLPEWFITTINLQSDSKRFAKKIFSM